MSYEEEDACHMRRRMHVGMPSVPSSTVINYRLFFFCEFDLRIFRLSLLNWLSKCVCVCVCVCVCRCASFGPQFWKGYRELIPEDRGFSKVAASLSLCK